MTGLLTMDLEIALAIIIILILINLLLIFATFKVCFQIVFFLNIVMSYYMKNDFIFISANETTDISMVSDRIIRNGTVYHIRLVYKHYFFIN